jgi:hypothetical protein
MGARVGVEAEAAVAVAVVGVMLLLMLLLVTEEARERQGSSEEAVLGVLPEPAPAIAGAWECGITVRFPGKFPALGYSCGETGFVPVLFLYMSWEAPSTGDPARDCRCGACPGAKDCD